MGLTLLPLTAMDPPSACNAPAAIVTRVDLPAPFSPTMACTSPDCATKSTLLRARTLPKNLLMPFSSKSTPVAVGGTVWLEISGVISVNTAPAPTSCSPTLREFRQRNARKDDGRLDDALRRWRDA